MKITPFWVSVALLAPQALAATESKTTSAPSTTSTTTAPTCTASLVTKLCSYPEPGPDFAVAEDSRASCWDYCNANPPCSFLLFMPGNPTLGTGTCWLYPGETYDASKGSSSGCSSPYLEVYNKPTCTGSSATATTGACTATATPSAVASVCGYPAPETCFSTCVASESATDCLSECATADSCSYVVFNPHNPDNSPYASGTCWIYPNGTYNAGSTTTCSGDPTQFVYENVCPKPSSSSSSLSSTGTEHSSGNGTASNSTGSTTSDSTGSTTSAAAGSTTTSKNSAPTGHSFTNPLAIGAAILMWQAL